MFGTCTIIMGPTVGRDTALSLVRGALFFLFPEVYFLNI